MATGGENSMAAGIGQRENNTAAGIGQRGDRAARLQGLVSGLNYLAFISSHQRCLQQVFLLGFRESLPKQTHPLQP